MQKFKPQFIRLVAIVQALRAGRYPTCRTLARELECSEKAVQRDIEYLKDFFRAPIEFDFRRNGYHLTNGTFFLPSLFASVHDLMAFIIGMKALAMYEGSPLAHRLQGLYDNASRLVPGDVPDAGQISARFTFRTASARAVSPSTWEAVAEGLISQREIEVNYAPASGGPAGLKRLWPCHLANLDGEWYLFAREAGKKDVRKYLVARMRAAKVLDTRVEPCAADKPDRYMAHVFGRHTYGRGVPLQEIVVRFKPHLFDYVSEKRWHARQTVRRLKDGRVELRFPVANIPDVVPWVMGFGADAEAIRPASLRQAVAGEIRAALGLYHKGRAIRVYE